MGFLSYDRKNKQTNSDYNFVYIDTYQQSAQRITTHSSYFF